MEFHTSTSLRSVHGLDVAAERPLGIRSWIGAIIAHFRDAARKRRDYQRLLSMSDAELRDIGVTRTDVLCAYHGGPIRRSAIRGE